MGSSIGKNWWHFITDFHAIRIGLSILKRSIQLFSLPIYGVLYSWNGPVYALHGILFDRRLWTLRFFNLRGLWQLCHIFGALAQIVAGKKNPPDIIKIFLSFSFSNSLKRLSYF